MISSVIASSHFYYIALFNAGQLNSAMDLVHLFPDKVEYEVLETGNQSSSFLHLQVLMKKVLGSEALLELNRSKEDNSQYWYDFYIGDFRLAGRTYYFICYPYVRLSTYIDDFLLRHKIARKFLKPDVNVVLDHMKASPGETKDGFTIEISKYSAAVKDDSANKINILGTNPLNSHVYRLLSSDNQISIEPLSLKLKCKLVTDANELTYDAIDLSFDKFGNQRFWLKRSKVNEFYHLIKLTIGHFDKIGSLNESSFISKTTILEDEQ